ncbi:UNVERIFIED_CONTAM: Solute carrier family 35 member F1 [Sesamum calycinum]|uniref:Solute carrier family 35 member F1 n=1 Tax=Sesamum calycinum TaxID=2727403 RepID=A0AAW2RRT3_9LAMI
MVNWEEFGTKHTLVGLGLGQFLSLLVTSTGFSSSELSRRGINAPTSQSFLNYVFLALVYGSIMLYRRQALKKNNLHSFWHDSCEGIPVYINHKRHAARLLDNTMRPVSHLVLFEDKIQIPKVGGSNPIKGDLLVIAGATLYGVSNVSEEYFVKSADRVELMAFLGIFGALISACQISILERDELRSIHWTAGAALPFIGFSVAMFLFYSEFRLIEDMWAVLIRIFAYHEKVDWMYFVAFAAVAVGLVVYSGGDKTEQNTAEVADEEAVTSNRDVASTSVVQKDGTETSTKS